VPKYIGPYAAIQPDGENGKVYHIGDNVNVAAARLQQLRDIEKYRFEDDPPTAVSPVHAQTEGQTVVMPPNEQGVAEVPVDDAKSKKD